MRCMGSLDFYTSDDFIGKGYSQNGLTTYKILNLFQNHSKIKI